VKVFIINQYKTRWVWTINADPLDAQKDAQHDVLAFTEST